jgi:hypothetical protein
MQDLTKKAITGLVRLQIIMALMSVLARLDGAFLGGAGLLVLSGDSLVAVISTGPYGIVRYPSKSRPGL